MTTILFVVAPEGYQDVEYNESKKALEEKGHTIMTTSTALEAHGKYGGVISSDLLIKDVKSNRFEAIVLIGGPGSHHFFDDPVIHQLCREFLNDGKWIGAICATPSILANAGLLEGVRATCFADQADNLKKHGAIFTGASVEQDGQFVTAEGPKSAKAFGKKITELLANE